MTSRLQDGVPGRVERPRVPIDIDGLVELDKLRFLFGCEHRLKFFRRWGAVRCIFALFVVARRQSVLYVIEACFSALMLTMYCERFLLQSHGDGVW